jgi:hypothetical protein
MTDGKPLPVPPRHSANVKYEVEEVSHGWKVTFTVRRLNREVLPQFGAEGTALYAIWGHVGFLFRKAGFDLDKMLENMSEWKEGPR